MSDPASAPILLIRFNFFTQMVSAKKKTQGQQQSLGDTEGCNGLKPLQWAGSRE